MLNSMGLFLILILTVACAEKRSVQAGITSKSLLLEIKGEPQSSKEIPDGEILSYPGNEKIQINRDLVTATFRDPRGDEKNVLFWRHAFRNCEILEKKLSNEEHPEIELGCSREGVSIVFMEGSGKVLRVSEHERD